MKVSINFVKNLFPKAEKFSDSMESSKHCYPYYAARDIFGQYGKFQALLPLLCC